LTPIAYRGPIRALWAPGRANGRHITRPEAILSKDLGPKTPGEARETGGILQRDLTGSLQYIFLAARPDITFAVNRLAQFLANPGHIYLDAASSSLTLPQGHESPDPR